MLTSTRYILNYLRDGSTVSLPSDRHALRAIALEAQYYQLPELVQLVESALDPEFYVADLKITCLHS